MKRFCSFLLVFAMVFTFCPSAFAASPAKKEISLVGEYVNVTDDEGNTYKVWVEATLRPSKKSSDGSLNDGSYSEGDQVDINVSISNDQLDLPEYMAGKLLSASVQNKLAKIAGEAMAAKVGKFLGTVGTVSAVVSMISKVNVWCGNNGFDVTGTFEWTRFQHQIQGIDLWDWGLVGVDIGTY